MKTAVLAMEVMIPPFIVLLWKDRDREDLMTAQPQMHGKTFMPQQVCGVFLEVCNDPQHPGWWESHRSL